MWWFVFLAKFRKILHEAIQAGLREDVDDIQRNGALQLQSGWMHINGTPLLLRKLRDDH
jgi:hypothetical protein